MNADYDAEDQQQVAASAITAAATPSPSADDEEPYGHSILWPLLAIVAVARASTAEMTRWQGWVVRFAHFVRGYRIHGEQRFRYVVPELVLFLLGLGVLLLWLSPFLLVVQVGRAFWVDFLMPIYAEGEPVEEEGKRFVAGSDGLMAEI
ncbi:hypothetical protein H2199_006372 [Coniosporium tulheliwenetii]|uniref:Uncharacterized protein n=1 Tax=Coniosporium tulheliwenetii TaxID=3383036 RepID=A0ACC2YVX1_9PEZI|nr:hypothetical protein H2199_006372 [Cladosporium sp. JES 115]